MLLAVSALILMVVLTLRDPLLEDKGMRAVGAFGWALSAAAFIVRVVAYKNDDIWAPLAYSATCVLICVVTRGHPVLVMSELLEDQAAEEWAKVRARSHRAQIVLVIGICVIGVVWGLGSSR